MTKPVPSSSLINTLSRAWADTVQSDAEEIEHLRQATDFEKSAKTSRQGRDHARGSKVLLAADNAVNQKVAVRLLEKLGCQVDVAPDGRRAVEMARQFEYELVLLDC